MKTEKLSVNQKQFVTNILKLNSKWETGLVTEKTDSEIVVRLLLESPHKESKLALELLCREDGEVDLVIDNYHGHHEVSDFSWGGQGAIEVRGLMEDKWILCDDPVGQPDWACFVSVDDCPIGGEEFWSMQKTNSVRIRSWTGSVDQQISR